MLRLAVLGLLLLAGACGGGGATTTPGARFPQWARERRDDENTGAGPSLASNRGVRKWVSPDLGSAVSTAPAIGVDGVVYVGTEAGVLYALHPEDGSVRWQFPSAPEEHIGAIGGAPAIDVLEQAYFGTETGRVFSVDSSGRQRWCFSTAERGPCGDAAPPGASVRTSPVFEFDSVDQRERVLFFGAADGAFYSVDAASGTLRWIFETRPPAALDASPGRDVNGTLYAAAADGTLYAWSRTGSVALRFSLGSPSETPPPPSIALATVFQLVPKRDAGAEVLALNPDATVLWRSATGHDLRAALTQWTRDTPDGPQGEVVAVARDGPVVAFAQRTGRALGVCGGGDADGLVCESADRCDSGRCESALFSAPGPVVAPAVAGSDGVLVIATAVQGEGNALYALAPRVCSGGDRNREPCRFDADCPGDPPGTCTPGDRACLGGTRAGASCASDADCGEGGACAPPDRFCTTQPDFGHPCASDADCAGDASGSCKPAARLCLGGERHGFPCDSDAACAGAPPGTCASRAFRVIWRFTGRFCDGGVASGRACAADAECPGGRCAGEPIEPVTRSPAIAADGTLYFGAGNRLYAVGG